MHISKHLGIKMYLYNMKMCHSEYNLCKVWEAEPSVTLQLIDQLKIPNI